MSCVGHAFMLITYVLFFMWSILLMCIRGVSHGCSGVTMFKLMLLLLGCVCHDYMLVVYAFVMHVNVYMLLCMHCLRYIYACIVDQTCIVRSFYEVCVIMMLFSVMILMH